MYVSIDLETTGLDLVADQIIEIGAVKFDESGIKEEFQTLVNPNIAIPPEVTRITGITNEEIKNAPQTHEVMARLREFVGDLPFVVHNADFDIVILRRAIFDFKNSFFDTLPLSQMLLSNMRSYSLETLSSHFSLIHEKKHRALDDAKATAELFRILLQEIEKLDPKTLEKIKNLKSDWNVKALFDRKSKHKKTSTQTEKKDTQALISNEKFESIISEGGNIIVENDPTLDIENIATASAKSDTIIALQNPKNPTIKEKSSYISTERFEKFLEKNFTDSEAAFAIKILIFLEKTHTGDKQEVALFKDEHNIWEQVCCDDFECTHGPECFFNKALKLIKKSDVITVSHMTLLRDIQSENKILPTSKTLILCDFEKIYDTADFALSLIYHSSRLENLIKNEILKVKIEMLFGMIWLMIEKNASPDQTYLSVEIEEGYKATKEWHQIHAIALFIDEVLKKEKPSAMIKKFQILIDVILEKTQEYKIKIDRVEDEKIKITLTPKNIKEILQKNIFESYKNTILISPNISVNKSFVYIKSKFGLTNFKEDFLKSDLKPQTNFYFIEDFKNMNRETLNDATINLAEYLIRRSGGKTLCVFLSKVALKSAFNDLYEHAKKLGIEIYAQDQSGGRGKITDNYIRNFERSALFILEHYFKILDLNEIEFDQILFNKFFFGDDENETILRIKTIFNKLLAKNVKRVFIADPQALRIMEKIAESMNSPIEFKKIRVQNLEN